MQRILEYNHRERRGILTAKNTEEFNRKDRKGDLTAENTKEYNNRDRRGITELNIEITKCRDRLFSAVQKLFLCNAYYY